MHNLCLVNLATDTIFSDLMRVILPEIHVKLQPSLSKIFWAKVEKVQKTHKLCIIMLINPSLNNFLENIIFDFQITIDTVHRVQISSRSDNLRYSKVNEKFLITSSDPSSYKSASYGQSCYKIVIRNLTYFFRLVAGS